MRSTRSRSSASSAASLLEVLARALRATQCSNATLKDASSSSWHWLMDTLPSADCADLPLYIKCEIGPQSHRQRSSENFASTCQGVGPSLSDNLESQPALA